MGLLSSPMPPGALRWLIVAAAASSAIGIVLPFAIGPDGEFRMRSMLQIMLSPDRMLMSIQLAALILGLAVAAGLALGRRLSLAALLVAAIYTVTALSFVVRLRVEWFRWTGATIRDGLRQVGEAAATFDIVMLLTSGALYFLIGQVLLVVAIVRAIAVRRTPRTEILQ